MDCPKVKEKKIGIAYCDCLIAEFILDCDGYLHARHNARRLMNG
jgi:hypothetical protein